MSVSVSDPWKNEDLQWKQACGAVDRGGGGDGRHLRSHRLGPVQFRLPESPPDEPAVQFCCRLDKVTKQVEFPV